MFLLWTFFKRDLTQEASYRFSFLWSMASLVFYVAGLYFLSGMLSENPPPALAAYGGNYFAFAVIGFALAEAMWACLRAFSMTVRHDQVVGTLEAMMATPTRLEHTVFYSGIYPLCFFGLRILLVVGFGMALGTGYRLWPLVQTIPVFALTMVIFGSLGLISASFTLMLKKGDPIAALFGAVSFLFSGAVYPVSAIPDSLQFVSHLLPITYAIEAARKLVLQGAGLGDIGFELFILVIFAVVASTVAFMCVRWSVKMVRIGGVRYY